MGRCPRETLERRNCPRKLPLSAHPQEKTSSQRTSSATVIPFRGLAELSMTARNYGNDIPELWEGHPGIMGRTRRNYDHDTPKLTARSAYLHRLPRLLPADHPDASSAPLAEFSFTRIIKSSQALKPRKAAHEALFW